MNKKTYDQVVSGRADNSIKYSDFQNLLIDLGFMFRRQNGSHAIYKNSTLRESVNIQSDGRMAKAYQVKQLRDIILKHGL